MSEKAPVPQQISPEQREAEQEPLTVAEVNEFVARSIDELGEQTEAANRTAIDIDEKHSQAVLAEYQAGTRKTFPTQLEHIVPADHPDLIARNKAIETADEKGTLVKALKGLELRFGNGLQEYENDRPADKWLNEDANESYAKADSLAGKVRRDNESTHELAYTRKDIPTVQAENHDDHKQDNYELTVAALKTELIDSVMGNPDAIRGEITRMQEEARAKEEQKA